MSDVNVVLGQRTVAVSLSTTSVSVSVGASQGLAGADGREIELQKTATHVQWRYVGDVSWTNLIALVDITGDAGEIGINVRGVYSSLTSYAVNDAVTHDGSFYICIQASQGNSPVNVQYWTKYVSKGDTGATGPAGDDGVTDHTLLSNIGTNTHAQIDSHIASTSNPHSVTKTQVGLGNVDNTSDVNKPVSTAQALADTAILTSANSYSDGKVADSISDGVTTVAPSQNAVFDALALKANSSHTHAISDVTGLQTALDSKVDGNTAIVAATKTKVTYDSKGLVTAGADATTDDISDSLNKRYVTDAQLTVIDNTSGTNTGDQDLSGLMVKSNNLSDLTNTTTARTNLGLGTLATQSGTFSGTSSGTNTGDQTSIVGITGTKSQFDTACADGDFAYQSDLSSYLLSSTAASTYQPLDTQLTDLAGLSYTGNALKVVRVNAGETGFELTTVSGSSNNSVNVSVNFGSSFTDKAQTVVTGQTWVTPMSKIIPQILTPSGADPDEMYLLDMKVVISDLVNGDGFTVTLYSQPEAKGTYNVMCIGQ